MWDLSLDWYNRVYACVKISTYNPSDDYHRCSKFLSEEASAMFEYRMRPLEVQQIKLCYFTPTKLDYNILKYKLKTPVLILND